MASGAYVLGTEPPERERLRLQHEVWLPLAQAAWERAQLAPGQRVLDLGAGPGFCSVGLARAVGAKGRGLIEVMIGSTGTKVARLATCSVLLVRS